MKNFQIMRNSSVELLRFIAMFFIVLSHASGHGAWGEGGDNLVLNSVLMQGMQFFGEVGNCIFILITGFFCWEKNRINLKSLRRLLIDVHFYSISIYVLVILFGICHFSLGGGIKALFPIVFTQYWFILPYITIFFLAPWLNYFIASLTTKRLLFFLIFLFLIECILPIINAKTISSNVGLFIFFYSVGAILKKSKLFFQVISNLKFVLILGSLILCYLLNFMEITQGFFFHASSANAMRFSFLPLSFALGLFVLFVTLNINSQLINATAKSVFAVYIISENPNVWGWLWKTSWLNVDSVLNSYYLVPKVILISLFVMVLCIIIDVFVKKVYNSVFVKG